MTSLEDDRRAEPRKRPQEDGGEKRPRQPNREEDVTNDPVEEADQETFPASDPPAWVPSHPGPPLK